MKRVSREELRTMIWVALSVLKPFQKRAVGVMEERSRHDVTDDLVQRIMGEPASEAVILRPSMVGSLHSPVHGRWGVDEPYPHPDLLPTDHHDGRIPAADQDARAAG